MKASLLFALALGTAVVASLGPAEVAYAQQAAAQQSNQCAALPDYIALQGALRASVFASGGPTNGGLDTNMWATIVDRDGIVCAVAFSGNRRGDQWPGSRVISAQKANTGNSFSLDGLALSSANLYAAVQPGGTLFGLQESNPVDTETAYGGSSKQFGTAADPMVGDKIGGINVFGGGLALYSGKKPTAIVGGLGVSGDTSCADHNVAWRVRARLGLDHVPAGVSANSNDAIIYDGGTTLGGAPVVNFHSAGGFGHPECSTASTQIGQAIGAATLH
jgi:uncharacterized protein GlcG (DUF336 family)